jgi:hypothetical protein
MTFFQKRKRKNDDPPRIPAWILVLIAIGLVIIVAIFFQPTNSRPVEASVQLVIPSPDHLDPFAMTATYIIKQATALAQGTPQPGLVIRNNNLDSLEITATALIKWATEQAGTPNS